MHSLFKKIVAFSMIGLLQIGIGTGVLEAASKQHGRDNQRYERDHRDNRDKDREERTRKEKERHEQEMRRRHGESEREWRERQERERKHHREIMRTIGGLAILYLILQD